MSVSSKRTACMAIGLLWIALSSAAADEGALPRTRELSAWQSIDPGAYGEQWLLLDRNEDGTPDYAVRTNDNGQKVHEAMDFNYDGRMDDFYFYENDVLQRQELDSNFDGQIDIWIYLRRGVYITMWERDRDFDGIIDDRERYGSDE